jgi:hypothetical protein
MAAKKELSAIAKKQLAVREQLWPAASAWLWDRNAFKGFTTIPKTMPLIMKIMDEMTKGAPVSSTYLTLWCATWDNSYVTLGKSEEMAHSSGFGGQRGVHTWTTRMKKLQDLHFIDIKAGKSGPMSHAIIWNPHWIIRHHYESKTPGLLESSYTAMLERALEVGAIDLTMPYPGSSPNVAPAASAMAETPVPGPAPHSV